MTIAEATPELTLADRADRAFFGHPKGLAYLAFTEAWERFSYYGMQTLLVLYMVNYLLVPERIAQIAGFEAFHSLPLYRGLEGQALASAIFGTYAASVYLTPILGGLLADVVLGRRRTVLLGACIMALGHFLMAIESAFLFALLCLVLGSGCLKGNIASSVGALYKGEDLRRADAFQIFYLGINAGVILAGPIVGTLGQSERFGWHWGFGAAGVGMLISLAIYLAGQKYLAPDEPLAKRAAKDAAPAMTEKDWLAAVAVILLIPVMAVAIVPNNQIFNVYLTWGDQHFDLKQFGDVLLFGGTFVSSYLVTIDSVVSVTFLFLVSLFYRFYAKRFREPDELGKIIIGSVFSVAGTLCLYMAAATTPVGHKIGLFWPMMFELLNSIAFAHMLPVSLALFARLAPKALNATVIGLYYLAFFSGNSMVGWVGGLYSSWPTTSFWLLHTAFAAVSGIVFLLFKLFLAKRLMEDATRG